MPHSLTLSTHCSVVDLFVNYHQLKEEISLVTLAGVLVYKYSIALLGNILLLCSFVKIIVLDFLLGQ